MPPLIEEVSAGRRSQPERTMFAPTVGRGFCISVVSVLWYFCRGEQCSPVNVLLLSQPYGCQLVLSGPLCLLGISPPRGESPLKEEPIYTTCLLFRGGVRRTEESTSI